jgi:Zn-dependent protease with chaperone function/uncharacterized tellurite resistance protein B-like protein
VEIVARLSMGEGELAQVLSGRRVNRASGIEAERRLVNVVDEMAIASGLAAPPVYLLTGERGINAFAAGRSPNQAIIAVTRGALDELSRDELQAVIAHEFSHIINGDIRLNVRALCVLQGIIFLAAIGRFMMRYYSGYGTEEGRRFFHLPLAAVGVGLFAIGWVGVPLVRFIQAAISREREYLADACAVQYTRNADALCAALARIKLQGEGGRLLNWHAEAMAHMLFSAASHPPIERRMVRANPHMPPGYYLGRARLPRPVEPDPEVQKTPPEAKKPETLVPKKATAVALLVASMGEPTPQTLEHAAGLLAYLPQPVRDALVEPAGAQAVMLGCLLEAELTARGAQLRALESRQESTLARRAEVLSALIAGLGRAYRMPLIALALPVLRDLGKEERQRFLGHVRAVIEADSRVTLSEFVFATILDASLIRQAGTVRHGSRSGVAAQCGVVLSLLAHAGPHPDAAFAQAREALGMPGLVLTPREALRLDGVQAALEVLRDLAPAEKGDLVAACAAVTMADKDVKLAEHELLRAVCSALDCPMPPSIAALDTRLLRQ